MQLINNILITEQLRKELPKLKNNEVKKIVQVVSQQISVQTGPYPLPQDYEYYHKIDSDLTDQMKKMVLEEQNHQHSLDEKYLEKNFNLQRWGQVFAFVLCVTALLGGFYTVLQGFQVGGTIIGTMGLVGIVGQFLKSR